jgi:transcriptional regulator with XRE-family HTH domain
MVELATPLVPAREARGTSKRDQWTGAGSALADEIWGGNYVGTISSHGVPVASPSDVFPEGISRRGSMLFAVRAGRTMPFVLPPSPEDLYWQAFRPLTSEIGVTVSEGECLISLPARMSPPAPDLVFWTESLGASGILIVAEAKLSRTDPADVSHAPAWRRVLQAQSTRQRPTAERERDVRRDAYSELRLLLEWTRLPVEQLGELLGASRRTIYNWLAGRPIRDEARIFRLRDVLSEIAASRDPALVRAWLLRGDPSPAMLATEERWDDLEARVRDETAPLRPIVQMPEEEEGEPRADSPEVLRAALVAFSTAPSRTTVRRAAWSPREITGIETEDEEDAE